MRTDTDATPTSIRLASGLLLDLAAPDPSKIQLYDIARSLSRLERFTGHCPLHPTVAQHSLAVECIAGELLCATEDFPRALAFPPDCDPARLARAVRRAALMHDAHEAYVSDVSAPAKRAMRGTWVGASDYDHLEARMEAAVAERFNCAAPEGLADLVHQADVLAYEYESGWGGWGTARVPTWVRFSPYVKRCYQRSVVASAATFSRRARALGVR